MTAPNDSALLHGGYYDPVKAREYYLRTRELKGRRRGVQDQPNTYRRSSPARDTRGQRHSRQEELRAQRAALEKRLDRLREVLAQLVAAAKARSGVKDEKESSQDKADRNESSKNKTPLTAKQKRDKARKAREEYQKEKHSSPSQEIERLKEQIRDIRAKIQKAIDEARNQSGGSNPRRR